MLEEPTIRKAGVVASQKRHLGRTIATGPLPFKVSTESSSECLAEYLIKHNPIPKAELKVRKLTYSPNLSLALRKVIGYAKGDLRAKTLTHNMKLSISLRSIVEYATADLKTKTLKHNPKFYLILERKVVVVGVDNVISKSASSMYVEIIKE